MGGNGRGWVWPCAMGCRDAGGHKNKASRNINAWAGHNFVALWPGKFPRTSCFAKTTKKHARSTPDGCAWIRMGAFGCIYTGGKQKQEKKRNKWTSRTCFWMHVSGQKQEQSQQVWSRMTRGILCTNRGQLRGNQTGINSKNKCVSKKTHNAADKKRKTSNDLKFKTVAKQAKNWTVRNEQKYQQKKSKQRKRKTECEITTTNSL